MGLLAAIFLFLSPFPGVPPGHLDQGGHEATGRMTANDPMPPPCCPAHPAVRHALALAPPTTTVALLRLSSLRRYRSASGVHAWVIHAPTAGTQPPVALTVAVITTPSFAQLDPADPAGTSFLAVLAPSSNVTSRNVDLPRLTVALPPLAPPPLLNTPPTIILLMSQNSPPHQLLLHTLLMQPMHTPPPSNPLDLRAWRVSDQ